ncbi:unnamed protein product [Pedinophyceae sp. YPF-701]|nr:unnamed protein product [Pedinophyceae sp. YPF-701]
MKEADINIEVVASLPFFAGLLALVMVVGLYLKIRSSPDGEGVQVEISRQVQEGAQSFLRTEYLYLIPFSIACAAFIVGVLEGQASPPLGFTQKGGWQTMICFFVGALLSATAGYMGMMVATMSNVKTMEAAKTGLNPALRVAFSAGAVMGFTVVSLGLLGITILLYIFTKGRNPDSSDEGQYMKDAVRFLTGFGFGASSIALFARVAGGIYTKAADVGADLVGKVESDIPEDDPRNPATIADNVGDNVGDVAGMGADLFESFCGSIIAAATLADSRAQIAFPFWIAGGGIVCAIIGFFVVRTKDDANQKQLLHSIHGGMYTAAVLVVGLSALLTYAVFDDNEVVGTSDAWKIYGCILIGLLTGILIGESTEYFTSYAYSPTKSITEAGSMGGAATVIIQGLGVGMLSCLPPVIFIGVAIIACNELSGVYGVSIAAVGMLSTLGVTLATDAYGPVADNAGGIAEMTPDCPDYVRERTDLLDALGNTTAATGKGFAIGSAVLTALSFLVSYAEQIDVTAVFDLKDPLVLAGLIGGSMLPYLFAALTMLSVRKAAGAIIVEVQRQFREIPGLLDGKEGVKCDTTACVRMCTQSSLKEMLLPGAIAVFSPIVAGLLVGARFLAGILGGSIASGFMLAIMMSNAGGAWDNSKKYVENENVYGGKKSATHKAVVVGDTVGDPFKDTSGPALNILIKLMSVFALVMTPLFKIDDWETWWGGLIALAIMCVVVGIAYYYAWVREDDPLKRALEEKEKEEKNKA